MNPSSNKIIRLRNRGWHVFWILSISLLISGVLVVMFLPQIGAALLLHPFKRPLLSPPPQSCKEFVIDHNGMPIKGWRGKAEGSRRGTLIYLHGVADNRSSGAGVLERFRKRGFDVIAYDIRAHGASGGNAALSAIMKNTTCPQCSIR